MTTDKRYFGKICEKHPELNGERLKGNSHCIRCHRENLQRYRSSDQAKERRRGFKTTVVCEKHPELGGLRYKNGSCIGCHRDGNREYHTRYRDNLKAEVFAAYGGKCTGCGHEDIDVLTIDHIDDGGGRHRQELKGSGTGHFMYKWLKDSGFPEGYQVLCANCNLKKQIIKSRNSRGVRNEPTDAQS